MAHLSWKRAWHSARSPNCKQDLVPKETDQWGPELSSKWDHVVGAHDTPDAHGCCPLRRRLCLRGIDCRRRRRRFRSSSASPLALLPSRGTRIPSLATASARRGNGAPPPLPRRPFGRSAAFRLPVAALALAVAQGSWLPANDVPFSDACCVLLVSALGCGGLGMGVGSEASEGLCTC